MHVVATAGMVALGIALATALSGRWLVTVGLIALAAPALWLCGGWVLPWTTDAYYRRLRRAWRDWEVAGRACWADYEATRRTMLERLEALAPPQQLEDFHARLVGSVAEPHGAASTLQPGDAWAAAMTEPRALTAQLRDLATSGHDAGYDSALQALRVADHRAYAHAASDFVAETRRFATRLAGLRIPRGLAAEHEHLVDAVREYAGASQQFALAWTTDSDDAVQAAVARLINAERGIGRAHAQTAERTGWRVRWPVEGEPC